MSNDPEYLSLLATVCERPEDDAPRLILSDWLEEHGEDERAEFIRLSIELSKTWSNGDDEDFWLDPDTQNLRSRADDINKRNWSPWSHRRAMYLINFEEDYVSNSLGVRFDRGFVSEVRLTCRDFCGGICPSCAGGGRVYISNVTALGGPPDVCPRCNGTGRIPGVAWELFAAHPIMTVILTDAVIHRSGGNDTYYVGGLDMFPSKYWRRLEGHRSSLDAKDELSKVCVEYGRELTELPCLDQIS